MDERWMSVPVELWLGLDIDCLNCQRYLLLYYTKCDRTDKNPILDHFQHAQAHICRAAQEKLMIWRTPTATTKKWLTLDVLILIKIGDADSIELVLEIAAGNVWNVLESKSVVDSAVKIFICISSHTGCNLARRPGLPTKKGQILSFTAFTARRQCPWNERYRTHRRENDKDNRVQSKLFVVCLVTGLMNGFITFDIIVRPTHNVSSAVFTCNVTASAQHFLYIITRLTAQEMIHDQCTANRAYIVQNVSQYDNRRYPIHTGTLTIPVTGQCDANKLPG